MHNDETPDDEDSLQIDPTAGPLRRRGSLLELSRTLRKEDGGFESRDDYVSLQQKAGEYFRFWSYDSAASKTLVSVYYIPGGSKAGLPLWQFEEECVPVEHRALLRASGNGS